MARVGQIFNYKGDGKMTTILYKKENNIAYVTINREAALNCFNYETLHQLQGGGQIRYRLIKR